MSTPLSGQRSAQRPLRAAVAVQRAVGRSLAATTAAHEVFVIETADGWRQIVFGDDGTERLVPYEMDKEHSYGR